MPFIDGVPDGPQFSTVEPHAVASRASVHHHPGLDVVEVLDEGDILEFQHVPMPLGTLRWRCGHRWFSRADRGIELVQGIQMVDQHIFHVIIGQPGALALAAAPDLSVAPKDGLEFGVAARTCRPSRFFHQLGPAGPTVMIGGHVFLPALSTADLLQNAGCASA